MKMKVELRSRIEWRRPVHSVDWEQLKSSSHKKLITRWDGERELFYTTSYTYYKIQNLPFNEST